MLEMENIEMTSNEKFFKNLEAFKAQNNFYYYGY